MWPRITSIESQKPRDHLPDAMPCDNRPRSDGDAVYRVEEYFVIVYATHCFRFRCGSVYRQCDGREEQEIEDIHAVFPKEAVPATERNDIVLACLVTGDPVEEVEEEGEVGGE